MQNVKDCWYSSIVMSDHAPVSIKIQLWKIDHGPKRWRLQTHILKDKNCIKFIEKCIYNYFDLNKNETSASIRWEAFKAYIRGEIISYTSAQNKTYNQEILSMEKEIKTLENEIYNNNNSRKMQNLTILRAKYDKLMTDKVAKSLLWTKQTYYDQGKKAGKLLAWRIKKLQADRSISSIKTDAGELSTDPIETNKTFKKFYEKLYESECNVNEEVQNAFLDQLPLKVISEEDKIFLDNPITKEEILEAIGDMNSGRAPGPDGLPPQFYKVFKNKLVQPLINMFNESCESGILPDSLRLATITLILKPN